MAGGSGVVAQRGSSVFGIFVGGGATRMGGAPKGLLPAPDSGEALVHRLGRLARATSPHSPIVLVGRNPAYADLGFERLDDDPPGIGPLGGLSALLREARRQEAVAVALACDMPYVTNALLVRLLDYEPEAAIVAPWVDERWQPLFARYDAVRTEAWVAAALAHGERALQRLFVRAGSGARRLPLEPGEERLLGDWDRPEDLGSQRHPTQ